jgi:4-hydroxybenzoate polyprenyltransferase
VLRRSLDALAFSSLWIAAAAAALAAASSRALGAAVDPEVVLLAACGTFLVYNVDRLRDLPRDHATSPLRSRFVARHRAALQALCAATAVAAAALLAALGARAALALAPVAAAGLAHRRLKRFGLAKPIYIALGWIAVVVGLPAVHAGARTGVGWACLALGPAILANAIASNLRDRETRLEARRALALARGSAALGVCGAALAPPPARALAAVPALTLALLLCFRPTERFGLLAIDGALLVGALVACALSA